MTNLNLMPEFGYLLNANNGKIEIISNSGYIAMLSHTLFEEKIIKPQNRLIKELHNENVALHKELSKQTEIIDVAEEFVKDTKLAEPTEEVSLFAAEDTDDALTLPPAADMIEAPDAELLFADELADTPATAEETPAWQPSPTP